MKRSTRAKTQQRSLESQHQVIEAVVDLIAERGFSACSTANIAARAGVSWGVLQYQFGGKREIFEAVLTQGSEELRSSFESIGQSDKTGTEKLSAAIDMIWGYYSRPRYRASMEILLNYSHEEKSFVNFAQRNHRELAANLKVILKEINPALTSQVANELIELVMATLRGLAVGKILSTNHQRSLRSQQQFLLEIILMRLGKAKI